MLLTYIQLPEIDSVLFIHSRLFKKLFIIIHVKNDDNLKEGSMVLAVEIMRFE
jgi:hypothetical protein